MFDRLFTEHPRTVGESYLEHLAAAWGVGFRLLVAGGKCVVHGFVPDCARPPAATRLSNCTARSVRAVTTSRRCNTLTDNRLRAAAIRGNHRGNRLGIASS